MHISRFRPVLFCDDLQRSQGFYAALLGLRPGFESEWYVELLPPLENDGLSGLELLKRGCAPLPEDYQHAASGALYLCFVVDAVDALHARVQELGLELLQAPRDEGYGQRRMLLRAPEGTLVDLSSPLPGAAAS